MASRVNFSHIPITKAKNVFGFPASSSEENHLQKTGTFRANNHVNQTVSTGSTENTHPGIECIKPKLKIRRIPLNISRKETQPKVLRDSNQNLSVKSLLYSFGKNELSMLMDTSNIPTSRRNTPSNERIPSAKKNLKIKVLMDYSKDIPPRAETTKGNYLSFNPRTEANDKAKVETNFLKNFESLKSLLVLKPSTGVKSIKAHQTKNVSPISILDTPDIDIKKTSPDVKLSFGCKKALFRSASRNEISSPDISIKGFKNECSNDFSELSPQDNVPFTTGNKKTKMFNFQLNESDLNSFRIRCRSKIELPLLRNRSVQSSPSKKLGTSHSASNLKPRPSLPLYEDFARKLENIIIKPVIAPVAITSPNSSLIDPFRTPKILFHREELISREKTPVGKISTKFKNQELILDKLFNSVSRKKNVVS